MAAILVIEDDEISRDFLRTLLTYEGHEVLLAGNGRQGLLMTRDRKPELILSDIRMPGMDGLEFCRELRKDPVVGDTYVILATGYDTPEIKTLGLQSGADDFIGKPIRGEDLATRVRLALRTRTMKRELARALENLAASEQHRAGLDATIARLAHVRNELLATLGGVLERLRDGEASAKRNDLPGALQAIQASRADLERLRDRLQPGGPSK
jgi:DNA-binding response OmpR family regulator